MVTEEKERLKSQGLKKPANSFFKMIRAMFCSQDDESSILKVNDPPPEKAYQMFLAILQSKPRRD
eukprot:5427194-Amphidinium_carterae.1